MIKKKKCSHLAAQRATSLKLTFSKHYPVSSARPWQICVASHWQHPKWKAEVKDIMLMKNILCDNVFDALVCSLSVSQCWFCRDCSEQVLWLPETDFSTCVAVRKSAAFSLSLKLSLCILYTFTPWMPSRKGLLKNVCSYPYWIPLCDGRLFTLPSSAAIQRRLVMRACSFSAYQRTLCL